MKQRLRSKPASAVRTQTAGAAGAMVSNSATTAATNTAPSLLGELLTRPAQERKPEPLGIVLASFVGLDEAGLARVQLADQSLHSASSLTPLAEVAPGSQLALASLGQGWLVLGVIQQPHSAPLALRVDDEVRLIEAQQELELRCGEASILLQADGSIQLRGTYITSHASATQRIRGGSVNIN